MRTAAGRFTETASLPMRMVDGMGTNVLGTHQAAQP